MPIRDFTSQLQDGTSPNRSVDNDAPAGLRQEFIDLIYQVHKPAHKPSKPQSFGEPILEYHPRFNEANLHKVITQSLGFQASGQPYGGFRYAVGRDISRADWPRVYDLSSFRCSRGIVDFDSAILADIKIRVEKSRFRHVKKLVTDNPCQLNGSVQHHLTD